MKKNIYIFILNIILICCLFYNIYINVNTPVLISNESSIKDIDIKEKDILKNIKYKKMELDVFDIYNKDIKSFCETQECEVVNDHKIMFNIASTLSKRGFMTDNDCKKIGEILGKNSEDYKKCLFALSTQKAVFYKNIDFCNILDYNKDYEYFNHYTKNNFDKKSKDFHLTGDTTVFSRERCKILSIYTILGGGGLKGKYLDIVKHSNEKEQSVLYNYIFNKNANYYNEKLKNEKVVKNIDLEENIIENSFEDEIIEIMKTNKQKYLRKESLD